MATLDSTTASENVAPNNSSKPEQGNKKKNFYRPKNKVGNKPPPPNKKSTTETQFTNDPLWKDSFLIDGATGLSEPSAKEFNADAAGFVYLVEQEYIAISSVDEYYAKSIPASAHAYYHMVLYWYEIALIAQKRGTASADQDRLVRFVSGYQSAMIAAGAGQYLQGLGDFQDFTGVKHLLKAREPNAEGHFGRATAQTHGFYETLPAPAIFYQRVVEDLNASGRGGRADDHWMLGEITPARQAAPEAAGPARIETEGEGGDEPIVQEHNLVHPTVNLLGWRPSEVLNANQHSEMQEVVDPDDLLIQRYAIRRELFELVVRRIGECKRYKTTPIPTTTGGSIVQQVTWKTYRYGPSRFKQFIEYQAVAMSRTYLPLRLAIASKIMCYRSIRREFEDDNRMHNTWACFEFPDHVPADWIANRNTIIQHGLDGLIDYTPFETQVTTYINTLQKYFTKFKTFNT